MCSAPTVWLDGRRQGDGRRRGALLDPNIGLPLLFCIGVAIGTAKKADGSTALAATAGFLVYYNVLHQFPEDCGSGTKTLAGVGCLASDGTATGFTYRTGRLRRHHHGPARGWFCSGTTAPSWSTGSLLQRPPTRPDHHGVRRHRLRRDLPVDLAAIGDGLQSFSDWLVDLAPGVPASSVSPTGRSWSSACTSPQRPLWFQFGTYTKPDGTTVHGDISMFLAGDPNAASSRRASSDHDVRPPGGRDGDRALRQAAPPQGDQRHDALARLTSFVTGITEPIEYSFVFIAPLLYAIHRPDGVSMALTGRSA